MPLESPSGGLAMTTLPLRAAFAVLGRLSPDAAAALALDLFFTPRGRRGSKRVSAFLATGRRFDVSVFGKPVAAWSWGEGPNVYLVHGWAGVGGQLAAFAPPLLESGFRVIAFDAPGHGLSAGRHTSIVHFAAAMHVLAAREGPPRVVIAHSLGAAATVRALDMGLPLERAVFLGPTGGPRDWAERFRARLGVPPRVMALMRERSERWLKASWDDFDIPKLARKQTAPLLVFHDSADQDVPWRDGAAIARNWRGAQLVTTSGLGHRRILRDPRVVKQAVAFARGEPAAPGWSRACERPGCENPAAAGGVCENCALEASLYFRDDRRSAWAADARL
jgi:pimeloyl-ACP methyl ester carboxylesterase